MKLFYIFAFYFLWQGEFAFAASTAVKRPRVLPPMFLPTYGKRASIIWPPFGENEFQADDSDDGQSRVVEVRTVAQNPYPVPPPPSAQLQRVARRPPNTLPVMKRAYLLEPGDAATADEVLFQRHSRRPPTVLPVMKRGMYMVDVDDEEAPKSIPNYRRTVRRPPTTLPVMKRTYVVQLEPYEANAADAALQRLDRTPPATLPVMKRGFWDQYEVEEAPMQRTARRPPTSLPVMKRNYLSDLYVARKLLGEGEEEYYKK